MMVKWSCETSSCCGSYWSSDIGPAEGRISAQKMFKGLLSYPIIDNEGRVVFCRQGGLVTIDAKSGKDDFLELSGARSVVAHENGIIVSAGELLHFINEGDLYKTVNLSGDIAGQIGAGFLQMLVSQDKKIYGLSDNLVVCLDLCSGELLWFFDMTEKFGLSGKWRIILGKDNELIAAGAVSWHEDDSVEYASYIAVLNKDGEFLWSKTRELDMLPTAAGNDLRMSVCNDVFWFSEDGVVVYDLSGKELFRDWSIENHVDFMGINSEETVFFMKNEEICSVFSGGKEGFEFSKVTALKGRFIDAAIDGNNDIYVLTNEGLFKISSSSKTLFIVSGLIGERICIGDGFAVISSKAGKITLVN